MYASPAHYSESFFSTISNSIAMNDVGKVITLNEWVDEFVEKLQVIQRNKNTLYFLGNGASASMSAHFATDFTKNARVPSHTLHDGSLLTCFANDYSYETAFSEMLNRYFKEGDGLICISSSGKSPNIVQAARLARELSPDRIFTFTGFNQENPLSKIGSLNLWVPICDYGMVESAHAHFLHMLIDMFCQKK